MNNLIVTFTLKSGIVVSVPVKTAENTRDAIYRANLKLRNSLNGIFPSSVEHIRVSQNTELFDEESEKVLEEAYR